MSEEWTGVTNEDLSFDSFLFVLLLYRGTKTPRTPSSIKGILKTDRGGPEVGFSINFKTHSIGELTSTNLSPFFSLISGFMSEILFVFVLTEDSISDVQTVKQ